MNVKASLKALGAIVYKNRATIETVAGMALVAVGTGVVISKAREAVAVSDELEERNKEVHKKDATDGWSDKKERSAEVRDILKTAVKGYGKAYWLGLTLEVGGLTLIAISDISMNKELTAVNALVATYAATLSRVRERVIEDQGEEKWNEYLYGPQMTVVDVLEDGTIVQTTVPVDNPGAAAGLPPHCFLFDEVNPNHEKDAVANRDFLEDHERWLNKRLQHEGFLFENDIRRDLGAELVKSGWTSGIFAEIVDEKTGDVLKNELTLGLDAKTEAAQRFREGVEPSILIQLGQKASGMTRSVPIDDNILDHLRIPIA